MPKYRKKPVEIEAWLFTDEIAQRYHVPGVGDMAFLSETWIGKSADDGRYYINTLEGDMTVRNGDYVIKGVNGEFYPCKPDIFAKTYDPVDANE
jgi:hypothetical protein